MVYNNIYIEFRNEAPQNIGELEPSQVWIL